MSATTLEYYGLSSFQLTDDDVDFLVDPWLEPEWISASPEDFEETDHVLVTHGAHDHLGATHEVAGRTGAEVITEPAVADHLTEQGLDGGNVTPMVWGNTIDRSGVTVRALEARHISYFESGGERVSGIPLSFLFEFDEETIYYLGDTAIHRDLELFSDLYDPTVALVPVGHAPGAFAPLQPDEAAVAIEMLDVEVAIPVHFTPESDAPVTFRDHVRDRLGESGVDVVRLRAGERYSP